MSQQPRHLMQPDPDLPEWKLPSLRAMLWTIVGVLFIVIAVAALSRW